MKRKHVHGASHTTFLEREIPAGSKQLSVGKAQIVLRRRRLVASAGLPAKDNPLAIPTLGSGGTACAPGTPSVESGPLLAVSGDCEALSCLLLC